MIEKKECSRCREEKPLVEFNRKSTTPDGRRSECRECTREYRRQNADQIREYNAKQYQANREKMLAHQRLYYLENREAIIRQQTEYRAKNIESWRAYRKRWEEENPGYQRWPYIKSKYGLTVEQYGEMFDAQGGVCAICGQGCATHDFLSVDHCHATGKIRGLLCSLCNIGLGHFRDETELLNRAIEYLAS